MVDFLPALQIQAKRESEPSCTAFTKSMGLSLNLSDVPPSCSSQSARRSVPTQIKPALNTDRSGRKQTLETSENVVIPELGPAPYTAATVLQFASHELTMYEQSEILNYESIYFFGQAIHKKRKKVIFNSGFDDSNSDYKIMIHDHLDYRYEVLSILGKGSFGQVLQCFDHFKKEIMAVKIIRNQRRFHKQALVEIEILQRLRDNDPHNVTNVIHLKEHFQFRNHVCITFELLSINLYEYVRDNQFQGVSIGLLRRFALQLLRSLQYMESQQVIHCDLKPENILLKNSKASGLRIIDFGSSCYANKKVFTYIQSRFYRAPEIILGLPYNYKIDIWSFGCILAELYMGHPLFPGESEVEQMACMAELLGPPPTSLLTHSKRRNMFFDEKLELKIVANSQGRKRFPRTRSWTDKLKCKDDVFISFLRGCLMWDPKKRLNARLALQHDWIMQAPPPLKAAVPRQQHSSTPLPEQVHTPVLSPKDTAVCIPKAMKEGSIRTAATTSFIESVARKPAVPAQASVIRALVGPKVSVVSGSKSSVVRIPTAPRTSGLRNTIIPKSRVHLDAVGISSTSNTSNSKFTVPKAPQKAFSDGAIQRKTYQRRKIPQNSS